jgi:hypothetical protein
MAQYIISSGIDELTKPDGEKRDKCLYGWFGYFKFEEEYGGMKRN